MIRNYFKIALRSLSKNKTFSAINVAGLSVGLTCCLLMVLYMQHELSYDQFQQKGDRIVRVIMEYSFNNSPKAKGNFTSTKVFPSFKQNFPEVEDGIRMYDASRVVRNGDKVFTEKRFVYADSTFFNLFSFRLLQGSPSKALAAPNALVLSASMAVKYFNKQNPVGKTLEIGSDQTKYEVTGVIEDCPSNSQIKYDFIASFSSFGPAQTDTYFNANYTTFLLLKNKQSIASLQAKIEPFMKKEMAEEKGAFVSYELEPFKSIHLHSPYDGFEPNSNITYIYIIAGIAFLVLVIACFTYINLSTARSLERAKEVGIRKVAGAFRSQVFWQFIIESLIITICSLVISILLIAVLLPAFNILTNKQLQIRDLFNQSVLFATVLIVIAISLFAGSYPAIILSKFQPVKVLKGSFKNTGSGVLLRKSLIVFQFAISVFLIASTVVIKGQMAYIQNAKIGYNREHVIVMQIDKVLNEKIDAFKTELKANPAIKSVSKANSSPVVIAGGYSMRRADANAETEMTTRGNPIDEEYVTVNGLEIIAGSNITKQDVVEGSTEKDGKIYLHYIINEAAARNLGFTPKDAIGKKMFLGDDRPGEIKAVVKDFHFASLRNPIEPLVMFPNDWGNVILVKVSGENLAQTISFLEAKTKQFTPNKPFEYRFMDEDFNRLYESETRTATVFNLFAGIAIILACLGLFGLSAFTAKQKTKEIGIRKVLGASVANISLLLSGSFIKLVVIAFVIACPLAWLVMDKWLQDFTYRINVSAWMMLISGIVAIVIAFLTVSFQSVKAGLANPVNSLKSE